MTRPTYLPFALLLAASCSHEEQPVATPDPAPECVDVPEVHATPDDARFDPVPKTGQALAPRRHEPDLSVLRYRLEDPEQPQLMRQMRGGPRWRMQERTVASRVKL